MDRYRLSMSEARRILPVLNVNNKGAGGDMNTANGTIGRTRSSLSIWSLLVCFIVVAASMALTTPLAYAAPGGAGHKIQGQVKLSGTVTNSYTGLGIAGATVTLTATGFSLSMVTDANGDYSNSKVPIGAFTMTTSATSTSPASRTALSKPAPSFEPKD